MVFKYLYYAYIKVIIEKGFIPDRFFDINVSMRNSMFDKSLLVFILFIFISCGTAVLVPPEIDLMRYERIGLISFSIKNAEGKFDEIATKRFLQDITRFQKGVKVIELGTLDEVLGQINKTILNQEAVKAIREHFGVTSFFHGEINVSNMRRSSREIPGVTSGEARVSVRATFDISMAAWLFSTETGKTLWTDSVSKNKTLSYLSVAKDKIASLDIRDQDEAYKELTENLVYELIRDFRPTKR